MLGDLVYEMTRATQLKRLPVNSSGPSGGMSIGFCGDDRP
jgi:hypothetical protein